MDKHIQRHLKALLKQHGAPCSAGAVRGAALAWARGSRDPATLAQAAAVSAGEEAARVGLRKGACAGLQHVTKGIGKHALKGAARANVIAAVATFAADTAIDTARLATGSITPREFGQRAACNGASAGGGCAGSALGAALGSLLLPGPGTLLGGAIGGLIGSVGASKAVSTLQDR